MEVFLEQLPIVLKSLNIGFLQTLRLFGITLLGAVPLGLAISFGSRSRILIVRSIFQVIIWVVRGTPLMIQLLIIYFSPAWYGAKPSGGCGESGRFIAASVAFIINYAWLLSEIYRGRHQQFRWDRRKPAWYWA